MCLSTLEPLPPAGYVLLALIEALRQDQKTWERAGGPDVLGALQAQYFKWENDPEVAARVQLAIRMVCARHTGRW